jgi:hypothetical protein
MPFNGDRKAKKSSIDLESKLFALLKNKLLSPLVQIFGWIFSLGWEPKGLEKYEEPTRESFEAVYEKFDDSVDALELLLLKFMHSSSEGSLGQLLLGVDMK